MEFVTFCGWVWCRSVAWVWVSVVVVSVLCLDAIIFLCFTWHRF